MCVHHVPSPRQWTPEWPEPGTCKAFPGGIPVDVFVGRVDHRDPVRGDHGIRFEPVPTDDPAAVQHFLDGLVLRHRETADG